MHGLRTIYVFLANTMVDDAVNSNATTSIIMREAVGDYDDE